MKKRGKKKRRLNKTQASKIHFRKRLKQRCDLTMNNYEMNELIDLIHSGKNNYGVEKKSNRLTIHIVEYKSKQLRVLYDKVRRVLVTVFI